METRWILTPQFFELPEPALAGVVPDGVHLNGPHEIPDRSYDSLAGVHKPITEFVNKAVSDGVVPVSVAGDCCAAIPVMAGAQAGGNRPMLVWLDAHGDFNTPETSPSGFLGGMPLAMMVGRGPQDLCRQSRLTPVDEAFVWLVGARDIDPLEKAALDASKVNRTDMEGFGNLKLAGPVHLHLDIDVIDASEAPGTRYPVGDGPSVSETVAACRRFVVANEIIAVSLSGWTGDLDEDGVTEASCNAVLQSIVAG